MLTTPDAPVNLENVPSITTGSQIGLVWKDGAIDGGADILDYTITWDRATGSWEIYEAGIILRQYTVTGLVASLTYSFKVQARNTHGLSSYSLPVSILSAQTPNQPLPPTTDFVGTDIVISWQAPISGGSPIIGYLV